jgi:hypothetical protein
MYKTLSIILALLASACGSMLSNAAAAPLNPSPEDRYIAARDTAIQKFSKEYDAGKSDDTAQKAEDAARTDLEAQLSAILGEAARPGFGPATLNLETLYKGDEGFGMLDALRFDANVGTTGEKAGENGADGKYVEPKARIVVTTQTLLTRWLRAHKDWWGKDSKNVPQQLGAALKDENFYTQAITAASGSAMANFTSLPITKPASATFAYATLAGRTQDTIPDAADEVFVAALADGKVYIAYGSIEPNVQIPACVAMRADYNKRAEVGNAKKSDDLRQQGEDAYKHCFTRRATQQPSFTEATKQAQALLAAALGR